VSDAATEYIEAKTGGPSRLPLAVGAVAGVVVIALAAVLIYALTRTPDAPVASDNSANVSNTARGLTSNGARTSSSPDAQERTIRVSINDGQAEVYRGGDKLGTTPYNYHGRLGEHVLLMLKREGYKDTPVEFTITDAKREYMSGMEKK
jgi:hypothetical protein